MKQELDPLLPEAQVDPDAHPALDWPTDPWDATDQTGTVERLRRQTRPLKWIVYTAMVLGIVMVMIAGAVGWWYLGKMNPAGVAGDVQSFTVAETDDVDSIAQRLYDQGLISDVGVFEWYVERNGGLEIIPGYYEIRPDDHMGNVLGRLRTPPGQTYTKVTFPEGFTVAKMAERLDVTVDRMTATDFITAATDQSIRSSFQPPEVTSLEGMLFPDTYQVSNAESEGQVIERMIALMERVGEQEDIVNAAAAVGRSPYEILIIASMIEREAGVEAIAPRSPASSTTGCSSRCRWRSTRRSTTARPRPVSTRPCRSPNSGRSTGPYNTYHERRPAADADRQSRPGVDPGGIATRRRTRRWATRSASICPIRRSCFYLYYVLGERGRGSRVRLHERAARRQRGEGARAGLVTRPA